VLIHADGKIDIVARNGDMSCEVSSETVMQGNVAGTAVMQV